MGGQNSRPGLARQWSMVLGVRVTCCACLLPPNRIPRGCSPHTHTHTLHAHAPPPRHVPRAHRSGRRRRSFPPTLSVYGGSNASAVTVTPTPAYMCGVILHSYVSTGSGQTWWLKGHRGAVAGGPEAPFNLAGAAVVVVHSPSRYLPRLFGMSY